MNFLDDLSHIERFEIKRIQGKDVPFYDEQRINLIHARRLINNRMQGSTIVSMIPVDLSDPFLNHIIMYEFVLADRTFTDVNSPAYYGKKHS